MKVLAKPVNFLKEVKVQLTKVAWPTKDELIGATAVVIVITAITAAFIGLVDFAFSRLLSWVFR
ncbi:MAG: preprotein translocase subunit SecE [Candidatus Omnitrophota bacterium]